MVQGAFSLAAMTDASLARLPDFEIAIVPPPRSSTDATPPPGQATEPMYTQQGVLDRDSVIERYGQMVRRSASHWWPGCRRTSTSTT